jgi:predicted TIM-barrel fold metal-dependent hydrolase
VARIRCCQVNSVEAWVFRETAQPDLLLQDIDVTALCWPAQFAEAAQELGASVDTLDGWLDLIDGVFARNSTGAVAVKSRLAYYRRLDLAADDLRAATTAFDRWRRDLPLSPEDVKALSDAATNRALRRAAQHGLPFKFHTGIYFNNNDMPLDRVRSNIADLCPAFQAHPDTTFVLFHIGYPYQHEALAAAKHYTNVHLDMCWTWIIDPVSSVRFLQAFVTTAPWTKLTAFGGDFIPVELVVGHADIARHGVTRAFEQLVAAGWLHNEDAAEVIDGVLWRNAERIYRLPPM